MENVTKVNISELHPFPNHPFQVRDDDAMRETVESVREYRKAGYSKKFLAEHESDILLHKAAKKAFDELGVTKLPTVKSLQAEYAELLVKKKAAYAEYRIAREEMKELLPHKSNIDRMLEKEEVTHDEQKKKHEHRE